MSNADVFLFGYSQLLHARRTSYYIVSQRGLTQGQLT